MQGFGGDEHAARPIVFLDLDDTLVLPFRTSVNAPAVVKHEHDEFSYLRPGTFEFVAQLARFATVAFFTNKAYPYSDDVVRAIVVGVRRINPLFVQNIAELHDHELNRMRLIETEWLPKLLHAVFIDEDDVKRTILVDDDVDFVWRNYGHCIPAIDRRNFEEDWRDGLMLRILPLIQTAFEAYFASLVPTQLSLRAYEEEDEQKLSRKELVCVFRRSLGSPAESCPCGGDHQVAASRRHLIDREWREVVSNAHVRTRLRGRLCSVSQAAAEAADSRSLVPHEEHDPVARVLMRNAYGSRTEAEQLKRNMQERERGRTSQMPDAPPEQLMRFHVSSHDARLIMRFDLNIDMQPLRTVRYEDGALLRIRCE